MNSPTLLIDADYFLYRACQAAEYELEFDSDTTFVVGDFNKGKTIVKQEIRNFCQRFETDKVVLTFTDTVNSARLWILTIRATA